jgi:hypothetical protein
LTVGFVSHYGTTQTDTDTRVIINLNLRTRDKRLPRACCPEATL